MSKNLAEDFIRFKSEVQKGVKRNQEIEGVVEPNFKKLHKGTYCIALISKKLSDIHKDENKVVFASEILSDLLTISKLSILGFEMPSLIVLRRLIENFYNHVYYFDHKIEYEHLNAGRNEYTPMDKLKLYFDTHPKFFESPDATLKEYNSQLFNEYHQLCKAVHTKGIDSMNLAKNLNELRQVIPLDEFFNRINKILLCLIYSLYKFHRELKFTDTEKGIIIALVPANKRAGLHD